MMDSNNFLNRCGVGEREARIASSKYLYIRTSTVNNDDPLFPFRFSS